jgi:hypothetical protein
VGAYRREWGAASGGLVQHGGCSSNVSMMHAAVASHTNRHLSGRPPPPPPTWVHPPSNTPQHTTRTLLSLHHTSSLGSPMSPPPPFSSPPPFPTHTHHGIDDMYMIVATHSSTSSKHLTASGLPVGCPVMAIPARGAEGRGV